MVISLDEHPDWTLASLIVATRLILESAGVALGEYHANDV